MQTGPIYTFGPFQLDAGARRLSRDGEPVAVTDRQLDVLLRLVTQPGQVVSKDALIQVAWQDVAVTDNSLEQAISSLRRALGRAPDGSPYIATLARRGYRFPGPVARSAARQTDDALEVLLAPYRMFVEGRAAIETLEREAVTRARDAFGSVVASSPEYASGHIGLANALALGFEATRIDENPDVAALQLAVHHAREGCRLDAASGEAWATLAFVLSRTGAATDAVAAGRRAIAVEPDNWRHHLRLAYATWGEERLRAAHQAVKLMPGLALAHWLAGTVYVARQAFEEAARELEAGTEGRREGGRFGAVGLHLLLGLITLARGDEAAADEAFSRELALERAGHIYTRQACANTWLATGAMRLRQSRAEEAADAFECALRHVPGHALALAAMSGLADRGRRSSLQARLDQRLAALQAHGATVDVAMTRSVTDVIAGRHAQAAARVHAAVRVVPAGTSAGWTLPVEPLFHVTAHPDEWAAVLAMIQSRAA